MNFHRRRRSQMEELNVHNNDVSTSAVENDDGQYTTTTRKVDVKKNNKYISRTRNSMSSHTSRCVQRRGGDSVGNSKTDDSIRTTNNDIHKTFDRVIPSDSMELLLLEHHDTEHKSPIITTTASSLFNEIPRNILMLDSPTLSDFHHHPDDDDIMIASQDHHSYERIESKDSSSNDIEQRGMTPIPFADNNDDTQQDEMEDNNTNIVCHHKLPFITLHDRNDHNNDIQVPISNEMMFPDDDLSSHSYSSAGNNNTTYYKTRYDDGKYSYPRQPTTSSNNLHGYHNDCIPYNYNSFHHDVAQASQSSYYHHHNMMQHHYNFNYSHLYHYGHHSHNLYYNNHWVNTSLTAGSVAKGMDHIPSKQQPRVVTQRSINMIVGDVLLNSSNDDVMHNQNHKYSNPRYVIRVSYKAFVHIKYQLPCLRSSSEEKEKVDVCPVNISSIHGSIRHYTTTNNRSNNNNINNNIDIRENMTELSNDIEIAIRRVESAIRFFGGCPHPRQSSIGTNNDNKNHTRSSIFRFPSSNRNNQCEEQQLIDDRYNTDGNRLSWDIEIQTPNVLRCSKPEERDSNDDLVISYDEKSKLDRNIKGTNLHGNIRITNDHRTVHPENRFQTLPFDQRTPSDEGLSSIESDEDSYLKARKHNNIHQVANSLKGKYLCKLCGKPKQNHLCPYEIRLQRSIGIMVYSAINAYSAAEPGKLAPALTDMNNFVSYDTNDQQEHTSTMQLSPTLGVYASVGHQAFQTVTPEQKLRNEGCNDPMQSKEMFEALHNHALPASTSDNDENLKLQSSLSLLRERELLIPQVERVCNGTTLSATIQVAGTKRNHTQFQESQRPWKGEHPEEYQVRTKKDEISYSQLKNKPPDTTKSKFVDSVILRPEHFRSVTRDEHGNDKSSGSYEYDPVPLPKCERQRLCDTLFHLITHEIPDMRDECLQVLHEVQQHEMLLLSNDNQDDIDDNRTGCEWDLAIAELLAQILVGLHCTDDDLQLDGLAKYLMSVGIAC